MPIKFPYSIIDGREGAHAIALGYYKSLSIACQDAATKNRKAGEVIYLVRKAGTTKGSSLVNPGME